MDINFAPATKGPDLIAIIGIAANIVAVVATSSIAIFSIVDGRRRAEIQLNNDVKVAFIGVRHALKLARALIENDDGRNDDSVDKDVARSILRPAHLSIEQALAKGIRDPGLLQFALNVQSLVTSLQDDVEKSPGSRWRKKGYLIRGADIAQESKNALKTLDAIGERIGMKSK